MIITLTDPKHILYLNYGILDSNLFSMNLYLMQYIYIFTFFPLQGKPEKGIGKCPLIVKVYLERNLLYTIHSNKVSFVIMKVLCLLNATANQL